MRAFDIQLPFDEMTVRTLRAGDRVFLSGEIITARDAAHKRMLSDLALGRLAVPLADATLYYTGPCPGVPGGPILSAGPTTSGRMDSCTVPLLAAGLRAMIGKGPRSLEVKAAIVKYGALYLVATGGAGALLAACIRASSCLAYPELGPEAVLALAVHRMPLIVGVDTHGNDIYDIRYDDLTK